MSDYIEYDEYGIREVKCMNCGEVVAGRTYMELPSRVEVGKTVNVLTMKRHSNWRQIKVDLSDGTFAEPIVCASCEHKDIDMENIEGQMKLGWEKELRFAGKSESEISKHKQHIKKLKVKGRRT
ncbi:MAG: hypothetical protein V3U75_01310 [Methylococcaceae bacterium]